MMPTMSHYYWRDKSGNIHVQNMVMAMAGQHHVHTESDFRKWRKGVSKGSCELIPGRKDCNCGLKAGGVRNGLFG